MKCKKLTFIFATILAVGSAVSCGSESKGKVNEKPFINPNPVDIVAANAKNADTNYEKYDNIEFKHEIDNLYNYEIIDKSAALYGLLIVENSTNHVGLYSLTNASFLVNCSYYKDWLTYSIYQLEHLAIVNFNYENNDLVVDNFGNVLYEGAHSGLPDFKSYYINNDTYLSYGGDYYKYTNGKISSVPRLPTQGEVELPDSSNEFEFSIGDLFVGNNTIKLDKIGLINNYLCTTEDGIVTYFANNGSAVSTFKVDPNSEVIITSEYLYYQEHISVPDDATNYSYVSSNNKYLLKTNRIELTSGKVEQVNFNYAIDEVNYLKDKSGLYRQLLISASRINNDKILELPRDILFDANLNKVGDYTGYYLDSFVKVGNNYFNEVSKILFDSNFNEITNLEKMNPQLLSKNNVFVGQFENKIGLIDKNGRVLVPFEFEEAFYNKSFDNLILIKDQDISTYNLDTCTFTGTYYDSEILTLDRHNEVYLIKDTEGTTIYRLDGYRKSVSPESGEFISSSMNKCLNDEKDFIVEFENKILVYKYETKRFSITAVNEENYYDETLGTSMYDCFTMNASEETYIHGLGNDTYVYVRFVPNTDGYYKVYLPTNSNGYSIINENGDSIVVERNGHVLLHGVTYYLKAKFTGYKPVCVSFYDRLTECNNEIDDYTGGEKTYKLNVNTSGYYKFSQGNLRKMYQVSDGKIVNKQLDYLPYSNASIMELDVGTYYLQFYNGMYSERVFASKFTINDIEIESNGNRIYIPEYKHRLIRYVPASTDNYVISLGTNFTVFKYGNGVLTEVSPYTGSGRNQYPLVADNTYIIDAEALNYSTNYTFSAYLAVDYDQHYYLGTNVTGYSNYDTNYILSVNELTYASVTRRDYCNFTIIHIENTNGYLTEGSVDTLYINDKYCFKFLPNERYVIRPRGNSYYNNYNFRMDKVDVNNLETVNSCHNNNPGLNKNIYIIENTVSSYYKFDIDVNNTYNLYRFDPSTGEKVEVVIETKNGIKVAYLDANTKYLLEVNVYDSTPIIFYSLGSDPTEPFTINTGTFRYISNLNKYGSTNKNQNNSNSMMTITINKAGTLTFKYDISSETSYDKIQVQKNSNYLNISPNSGYYTNQSYSVDVISGDVIKIYYTKDSSYNNNDDMAYIYNIALR